MASIDTFKHLLPRGLAWCLTQTKSLRSFFLGLTGLQDDFKEFIDLVWLDIFPETTRELSAWEEQFYLPTDTSLTDQQRRDRLTAAWSTEGGQSPRYIQDVLQANGFDAYVHDWWVPGQFPATARAPITSVTGDSYMLVNIILQAEYPYVVTAGATIATAGHSRMTAGNYRIPTDYTRKQYPIPNTEDEARRTVYVGGAVYPAKIQITADRIPELERLCLKLFPEHLWIGLLIDIIP